MFKKFTAIILTICFLFALSSCGENASSSSPLKASEFISARVDEKTSFRYDEYEDYIIITGINGAPDELKIPETLGDKEVRAIGDNAFADMGWVTEIDIPDTVVEIGKNAFSGAVSAKKISLSENLYSIGSSAFFGARKIENIRLPLDLKVIGGFAFADCEKLEGISIPKVTFSIGGGAFQNTEYLNKQTDEFVIVGDNVLIHYNGEDEKVTIPEDVKTVSAFCDNFFVKEVVFPESAEEIGEYAFVNSSVEKLSFVKAVQSYLSNAETFLSYKTNHSNQPTYAYFSELATKMPIFPLQIAAVDEIKSVTTFLSEELAMETPPNINALDKLLELNLDFKEESVESILSHRNSVAKY